MLPMIKALFSPYFLKHRDKEGAHPESPDRLKIIRNVVESRRFSGEVEVVEFEEIFREKSLKVHDPDYINYIKRESEKGFHYIDPDTYVCEDTFKAGITALSVSYEASEISLREGIPVFVFPRPPGHHAGRKGAALNAPTNGFCIFNNAAAATLAFRERGMRVAVIDFDAHHGNGTQEIFWTDPQVLHIDIHEYGIYPGTGWIREAGGGVAKGTKLNVPLPKGATQENYRWIFCGMIPKVLEVFKPEALVVSAGFDPHVLDSMSTLRVSNEGFRDFGIFISHLISSFRIKAFVNVLEGGYGYALKEGLLNYLDGLLSHYGVRIECGDVKPSLPSTWVKDLEGILNEFWGIQ